MLDIKDVKEFSEKFNNDVELLKKEMKKVQSQKCRLLKQKSKKTYESELTEILKLEQLIKETRSYLVPKLLTVTTMNQEQINELNYDETIKAIKSIQSKKCNSQYETDDKETNTNYQEALRIEKMLLEHKKNVKPIDETVIKKSSIDNLIEQMSNLETIDKDYLLEQLNNLKQK
jgi:hypothetical protein